MNVIRLLRDCLFSAGLLKPESTLLFAVSGGADSMALLYAGIMLRKEIRYSMRCIHIQHGLRGRDSELDEELVCRVCHEHHVPCVVRNAGLSGTMNKAGIETEAREKRIVLFCEEMAECGAQALLCAHHADDQAETVLMHLLRGSGISGLAGIRPSTAFGNGLLLRPFLEVRHSELCAWLTAEGVSWREDLTNHEMITPRNVIRREILPRAEELFPGCTEHIGNMAALLSDEDAFLDEMAASVFSRAADTVPPYFRLDSDITASEKVPIRRRILRRWYREGMAAAGLQLSEKNLNVEQTGLLDDLLFMEGSLNLPGGLKAEHNGHYIYLLWQNGSALHPLPRESLPLKAGTFSCPGGRIVVKDGLSFIPKSEYDVCVPVKNGNDAPVFRYPQEKDRIRPLGSSGSKPLRRWFTDHHIDTAARPWVLVLARGSEILWIPGKCTSETLRVLQPGQPAMILQYSSK